MPGCSSSCPVRQMMAQLTQDPPPPPPTPPPQHLPPPPPVTLGGTPSTSPLNQVYSISRVHRVSNTSRNQLQGCSSQYPQHNHPDYSWCHHLHQGYCSTHHLLPCSRYPARRVCSTSPVTCLQTTSQYTGRGSPDPTRAAAVVVVAKVTATAEQELALRTSAATVAAVVVAVALLLCLVTTVDSPAAHASLSQLSIVRHGVVVLWGALTAPLLLVLSRTVLSSVMSSLALLPSLASNSKRLLEHPSPSLSPDQTTRGQPISTWILPSPTVQLLAVLPQLLHLRRSLPPPSLSGLPPPAGPSLPALPPLECSPPPLSKSQGPPPPPPDLHHPPTPSIRPLTSSASHLRLCPLSIRKLSDLS